MIKGRIKHRAPAFVTSRRRGGLVFGRQWQEFDTGALDEDQLSAITEDPMLELSGGEAVDDELRLMAVNEALAEMLRADPEQKDNNLWKKDKSPRVAVVRERAGVEASAEEIAKEWELMGVGEDPAE